ncbi:uncharacterized protein TNCT_476601 [Trichonephila clavata]|uniref:Uncharacterized protein n=1 Tax=Trichonephila clavata TaxID=2740835 RepID=A0A8X6HI49_TRICU|nr:uncharacterized protein TNCT_476601 [Trichonephila clavata]
MKASFIKVHILICLFVLSIIPILALETSLQQSTIREYAKRTIQQIKLEMHNALEKVRIRRSFSFLNDESPKKQTIVSLYLINSNGEEYVFCGSGGAIGRFNVEELECQDFTPNVETTYSILAFEHRNRLWLIVNHYESKHFLRVYHLYDAKLHKQQRIIMTGETISTIVEVKDKIYLFSISNKDSDSILNLYEWIETQFDSVTSLSLKGNCKSLDAREMNFDIFIALSMDQDGKLNIFRFSESDRKLVPVQNIDGRFKVIKYFEVARNYYLIGGEEGKIILYHRTGDQFTELQEISSDLEPVVDISTFQSSNGLVIIVITKISHLDYYFRDSSSHFIMFGRQHVEYKLKTTTILSNYGDLLLLLLLTEDGLVIPVNPDMNLPKPSPVLKLNLLQNYSQVDEKLHVVADKINKSNSKLHNVWIKEKIYRIPTVLVNGSVTSNKTAEIGRVSFSDDFGSLDAQFVSNFVSRLKEKTKNLSEILKKAVMKSRKQEIIGNIEFVNGIVADSVIDVAELKHNLDLNGINTSKLSSTLKTKGFQIIPNEFKLNGMEVTHVKAQFLNNNTFDDYILLTGTSTVEGEITFTDLSISNMWVSSELLNNISLRNIVRASGSQNISKKQFNLISSKAITTKEEKMEGVNMSKLRKFVSMEAAVFNVQVNFSSDVIFENVDLHSINGFNLSHLILDSVKCSRSENIKGKKIFLEPVTLKEELFVMECVNSMELNNLMTLHEEQTIKNIEFLNVSFKEIKTHSLNNVDLCKEAIQKSGSFKLKDSVHFQHHLEVFNITMKNNVSIDSMDLSDDMLLVPAEELVSNNSFTIEDVVVLNVEIHDSEIATLLSSLSNNVWYKNRTQNVSEGNFNILKADCLKIDYVNGIHLDEIALSKENSTIYSNKTFEYVEVESLSVGKLFNYVDFTLDILKSLKMETLHTFKAENMFIKGSLDVSVLNDLDILNLMQVKKLQKLNGDKRFNTISLKNLTAANLNFDKIYSKNFTEYIFNAVNQSSNNKTVFNKRFSYLSGKEMINEGFLNGRKFEKLLNSVVTLTFNQNVSCNLKFSDPLNIKTLFVKNFDLINLNDVVFTDEIGKNISNKVFTNKIFANKAEFDIANGVNVSNLKNVFFKGQDNRITKMMTFQSDLKMSKLQVQSSATIDGVNLDDVIKVDSKINATALSFSVMHTKGIKVNGKINGCDLSNIENLPMKNISIKSEGHFINLTIEGNLDIKNTLNGLSEDMLLDITSNMDYDDDVIRQHEFLDIKATHLQVLNGINSITIDSLIEDAVRQNESQVIKGIKSFHEKLTANSTSIEKLNVTILNKINFPLLYTKHLNKKENQNISLTFTNITADKILIEGTVNGIKLPEDVVLTYTEEKIYSPTIINRIIMLPNIDVTGLIDSVNMSQLLDNKVSLRNPVNISSTLTFLKNFEVKGNLKLINSVNEINLSKVVKTKSQVQPVIEGNKILSELSLHSDLNALNFIGNLSENLCRNNNSEFFDDMVSFPKIKVSSLNATFINNISVGILWELVSVKNKDINDKMDNLTDMINEFDDGLEILRSSIDPLSLYVFFELHQMLNLGPTLRFLPVYEGGIYSEKHQLPTIEIIAWLDLNETCRHFKSVTMNVEPDGSLKESKKVQGRVFPFTLHGLQEEIKGFTLHVDRSKRCTVENQKSDILKMAFASRNESRHTLISPPDSVLLDAKILEIEKDLFLVVAYKSNAYEKMYLHKYDLFEDTWIEVQKFHTSDISSFDLIHIDDLDDFAAYLAVTGTIDTPGIHVYSWDFEMNKFHLDLHISKSVSSSALWVYTEREVFLLLAKENTKIFKNKVWAPVYSEPIEVYLLKDDMKLNHEINVYGISSLETFSLSGEIYVLAVSRHLQTIYVIQYQGYDGFQVIQEIHAPGVTGVSIFSIKDDILLAIASKTGHTKVLKCIARGAKHIYGLV